MSRGGGPNFLSPLRLLKFWDFLSFLFIMMVPYSKPLYNTLNYASTANILEVSKFYNVGDKRLEIDCSRQSLILLTMTTV